jgi:hypothetical protein
MAHKKGHIGSANEDATTYGMPRREAVSRGKQHLNLLKKSRAAHQKASDKFYADPSIKNLNKLRKQAKKTGKVNKAADKLVLKLSKTQPKPYGSEKGYN